ncbi:hypothetical protein CAY53_05890 [Desulfobulbus oralis]|uniref:Uncharacterized protein n=1 Tax=Desulfobulbus oralis TaxID=1986146 RepID=A0A2L1GN07_9BACT|nr:hypothetical protein CAY53_05890 [Desulfobulbus oralis]
MRQERSAAFGRYRGATWASPLIQGQDARSGAGSPETVLSQLKNCGCNSPTGLLEHIVFTWAGAAELAGNFADDYYPEQCLSLAG